jgi:hypothetical protein
LPSFSLGRQVAQLLPPLLDDALLKQRVDHPSSVVIEPADDVTQVELFVEEEYLFSQVDEVGTDPAAGGELPLSGTCSWAPKTILPVPHVRSETIRESTRLVTLLGALCSMLAQSFGGWILAACSGGLVTLGDGSTRV